MTILDKNTEVKVLENSILPYLDRFENIANIPLEKFGAKQCHEILEQLRRKNECLRIVSYNVLFNLTDQSLAHQYRWPQRLARLVELLNAINPDIITFQELYNGQLDDVRACFDAAFGFYAYPSVDGEKNTIFYRKTRFELLQAQGWQMPSDPQDDPGTEALTMVVLKDMITGKSLAVFTTHLPYYRVNSRFVQAEYIAQTLETYAKQIPVFFTGDLNTFPSRLDLESLPFYDGDYVHHTLSRGSMADAREISLLGHLGPLATFTNSCTKEAKAFTGTGTPGVFLDHIYVSDKVKVLLHAIEPATVDGLFASDHMPVIVDCLLN